MYCPQKFPQWIVAHFIDVQMTLGQHFTCQWWCEMMAIHQCPKSHVTAHYGLNHWDSITYCREKWTSEQGSDFWHSHSLCAQFGSDLHLTDSSLTVIWSECLLHSVVHPVMKCVAVRSLFLCLFFIVDSKDERWGMACNKGPWLGVNQGCCVSWSTFRPSEPQ